MKEYDKRILEGLVAKYGKEYIMNAINEASWKKAFAIGALSASLLGAGHHLYTDYKNTERDMEHTEIQANRPANFDEKVEAVQKYMENAVKNYLEYTTKRRYNLNKDEDKEEIWKHIQLSPKELVLAAYETDFDLPMMMAQAHQESCFGVTPRARRTNSVFSVGSWDDGTDLYKYKTQNQSILPYIRLLQKDYMVNGKTELDLLKPGAFVNYRGHRYAGDLNYENAVKSIRNKIIKQYPVLAN